VGLHGLDQFQAGLGEALSGCQIDSLTSSGLQAAGLSQGAANLVDAGLSVGGGSLAGGGAAGARAGKAGFEFSHWIPDRMGGPRSIFNGNWVSQRFHYLTDNFRYPPPAGSFARWGPKFPRPLQQVLRVPWAYAGAGAGTAAGGGEILAGRACGCH